jgi:RNase H-like domain found in reverse transcriptase/Integrase zinc binding domain
VGLGTTARRCFQHGKEVHTDASHYQLGAVISQEGKPIAFYSRKLNPAQTRYTTTERELLSIVKTLKEYRNILLGQQIEVFTDHKNLVYKTFNTERIMRWWLIIKEFGPKLTYIKGASNIVADALSRMRLTKTDFGPEVFATDTDAGDFPTNFPLSYTQLAYAQSKDRKIQASLKTKAGKEKFVMKTFGHLDKSYKLVTKDDKIVIPSSLQRKATKWYHMHLLHPGETRLELMLKQHFTFVGLKPMCVKVCKACQVCRTLKKSNKNYRELPPKQNPELIPWHTLCVDLIGPYPFGKVDKKKNINTYTELWCITMIDPATGLFEIAEIPTKRADFIANLLEFHWLTCYPWPTKIRMD